MSFNYEYKDPNYYANQSGKLKAIVGITSAVLITGLALGLGLGFALQNNHQSSTLSSTTTTTTRAETTVTSKIDAIEMGFYTNRMSKCYVILFFHAIRSLFPQ